MSMWASVLWAWVLWAFVRILLATAVWLRADFIQLDSLLSVVILTVCNSSIKLHQRYFIISLCPTTTAYIRCCSTVCFIVNFITYVFFTARYTILQSAVLRLHVVRLSVCPSVCDVGGLGPDRLEIWKLIAWTISPTLSLYRPKAIHLLPGKRGKILGD